MKRYLEKYVFDDLAKKMVFIGGPRQVGKTTFSLNIAKELFNHSEYLSWDIAKDREKILNLEFQNNSEILIFDEIHKYQNWKNHIKGLYDSRGSEYKIVVTGSSRLDVYRRGGDSMFGRYHYYRLHPISLAEALKIHNDFKSLEKSYQLNFSWFNKNSKKINIRAILDDLLEFGGFPEPFFAKSKRNLNRWQKERKDRVLREDIRDLELIREFSLFQILTDILPIHVTSVFSLNSLRDKLQVSHLTLSKWVQILEDFYYCFRIPQFSPSKIKSLRKMPKLYLWDYSEIEDVSKKFENLIASHLLKFVHFLQDWHGFKIELQYLRDAEQREVDFLITFNNKPTVAIEIKTNSSKVSNHLVYFKKRYDIPHTFQVILGKDNESVDFTDQKTGVNVISADKFLTGLI